MSTLKTQTIQPPSDSDGLTFRTNQSDRVTIGADGFVRISNGTVTGGITLNGTLNLIGGITASGGATFGGGLRITDSTASSSTSTGALTVSGGVGVGGALYVSSTGNFGGLLTLAGATSSAVLSCSTAPTQGQHLANKTYVDSLLRVGSTYVFGFRWGTAYSDAYGFSVTSNGFCGVPSGTWNLLVYQGRDDALTIGPQAATSITSGSLVQIANGGSEYHRVSVIAVRIS